MKNKIKKRKCAYHEDSRDISEYVFWVTDIRRNKKKKYDIDIWECKKCKEHLDRAIARADKIREHNKIQNEISEEKKIYQINIGYRFDYIPEFYFRECSYFLKNNGCIRIILKI